MMSLQISTAHFSRGCSICFGRSIWPDVENRKDIRVTPRDDRRAGSKSPLRAWASAWTWALRS